MTLESADAPLRISIVTPNFNGAAFIEETLKSVVGQNYSNLEFIVVDGASADASLSIIKRYEGGISRLIVERDNGHADALNKGFRAATGEILGWINSDDILLPGALAFINRLFRSRPDIEWITGRPSSMNENGEIGWVGPLRAWSRLRFLAGDNRWIQQESTFWRRSLWGRAGGALDLRYSVANDFALWARFFRFAELHTVNRPLGCFRVRGGQRSILLKRRYESEARAALSEEWRALEAPLKEEARPLLPRAVWARKPPSSVRRDVRYAQYDPPIIRRDAGDARAQPKRRATAGVSRATAPDDLSSFRNIHRNERCFVMGNGPSLNQMDLNRLDGQIVFACNSAFLLFPRISWRPRYYTCVDSRVLPDRAVEIDEMLSLNPGTIGFFPAVIQEHTGQKRRSPARFVVSAGANRYFFNETSNSTENLPHSMFSYDIDANVVQPFTVAITMLQIAAYMGFREIVLIGCDTNYVIPRTVSRLKEKEGPGVALVSRRDDDPNHFDPRYFGRNRKWHDPQPEKMIAHYAYAKQALDAIGVVVYNATVGGRLEVFPRREFREFVG
jgi:glycosyltransferase involved in cell wall biosynthesis